MQEKQKKPVLVNTTYLRSRVTDVLLQKQAAYVEKMQKEIDKYEQQKEQLWREHLATQPVSVLVKLITGSSWEAKRAFDRTPAMKAIDKAKEALSNGLSVPYSRRREETLLPLFAAKRTEILDDLLLAGTDATQALKALDKWEPGKK